MKHALAAARLLLGGSILIAIGWQLSIHRGLGLSGVNFFSFFTNLSNLFAAAVLLAGAVHLAGSRPPSPRLDLLRNFAVVYITVVGIVFVALLRNEDLGSLRPWINVLLHYVVPVAMVIDWMADPPAHRLTLAQLSLLQVFPLIYLAYTLARGAATGWYPYPFLNPAMAAGYAGVSVYVVGIVVVFLAAGWTITSRA